MSHLPLPFASLAHPQELAPLRSALATEQSKVEQLEYQLRSLQTGDGDLLQLERATREQLQQELAQERVQKEQLEAEVQTLRMRPTVESLDAANLDIMTERRRVEQLQNELRTSPTGHPSFDTLETIRVEMMKERKLNEQALATERHTVEQLKVRGVGGARG